MYHNNFNIGDQYSDPKNVAVLTAKGCNLLPSSVKIINVQDEQGKGHHLSAFNLMLKRDQPGERGAFVIKFVTNGVSVQNPADSKNYTVYVQVKSTNGTFYTRRFHFTLN